ncbi:MAG: SDR family NAD(P)-dependent oxidoreductase [Sumerlaeia bacterium]
MKLKTRCALIVGASSGMGEALAHRLAGAGWRVALVARREDELRRIADAINAKATEKPQAFVYPHDATDLLTIPKTFDTIAEELGGLDLAIYAAGIMPAVGPSEYNAEKDRQIVEVNLIGAMGWMNEAADLFARLRRGTVVGLGSVSGDRGRKGNPAYAASKAGFHCYLESLRNRLDEHGVNVITIKPGPVDTPMTRSLGKAMPFLISADEAARQIVRAVEKKKNGEVYVPGRWRPIMGIIKAIPSPIFRRLGME